LWPANWPREGPSELAQTYGATSDDRGTVWFVRLTDRFPILLIMLVVFVVMGSPWWPWLAQLFDTPREAWTNHDWLRLGSAFFFPIETTYGIWLGGYLVRKTLKDVDAMQPFLDYSPQEHEQIRYSLTHVPGRAMLIAAILGAPTGFILQYFAGDSAATWFIDGGTLMPVDYWWMLSPMILWILVFQLALVFGRNASTISRVIDQHLNVDLLHIKSLSVFASGVIRNTLVFVLGTIPFPLLMLDGNINLMKIVPGYALIIAVLLYMLIMPIRAVHRRISEIKDLELERIRLAMLGDRSALADSRLAEDAETVRMPELIAY
jgi:hypothetical protein